MISFKSLDGKCSGTIVKDNHGLLTISASTSVYGNELKYIAAAPADLRTSYMGSGLPFANPEMAYEGTENRGVASVVNGRFQITVKTPNAYYVNNGTKLILPHVHVDIGNEYFDIPLGDAIPSRSLSSLPGKPNRSTRR